MQKLRSAIGLHHEFSLHHLPLSGALAKSGSSSLQIEEKVVLILDLRNRPVNEVVHEMMDDREFFRTYS